MSIEAQVRQAAEALQGADALLISAGAGMGVDSGLPDFRGPQGFWKAYPAVAHLGYSFAEMANPTWFVEDPGLAWAFYGHRLNLYRRTTPHAGFAQLLEWAKTRSFFVFTSNVDGQFQKAGFPPERMVECHGSIHFFQCTGPCSDKIWDAPGEDVTIDEKKFRALEPLPRCPECGGLARPNILMFGDYAWARERTARQEQRFELWLKDLRAKASRLVVIEFGAGTEIPTVRYKSEEVTERSKGRLIRVNPREADIPDGQIALALGAAEAIAGIAQSLEK